MQKIAVVGATGLVGHSFVSELLKLVAPENLVLLASERSAGLELRYSDSVFVVKDLAKQDFSEIKVAFFSAGASVSSKYAPDAMVQGSWVIDNSSAFRSHMPLVVPEVNKHVIKDRGIISNPNCVVIPLVLTLNALKSFDIKSVNVVTFQSVSGSGRKGVKALRDGDYSGAYPAPIVGNVIPFIDDITENGFTKEEMKLHHETSRIMGFSVPVTATTVRVPVFKGHSMAVSLTASRPWDISKVHHLLSSHPSVKLIPNSECLTPKTHVEFCPGAMVSRIRVDHNDPCTLLYWLVSDNLLKGAALNAIQIAQSIGLIEEVVGGY